MAGFLAAAGLIGGAASAAGHGLADSHKRAGDVGGADVIFQTATADTVLTCLMLCAGCTSAPPAPTPVIVHNACPKVSLCPMPGSDPETNGDLSADIRQLENALARCASQVKMIKHCQDENDAQTRQPAQGAD